MAGCSIDVLHLGTVEAVPEGHPEHDRFRPFPVRAWLIHHPDGPFVVDTGIGEHPWIDEHYRPRNVAIEDALAGCGVAPADVAGVVLSHLHFDHCGQQAAVPAPVYVQRAEHEVAATPRYTVPAWADIGPDRLRLLDGDAEIAPGIRVLATPGHTPGHQSVAVTTGSGTVVLGGQCAFTADEVRTGRASPTNLHDGSWASVADTTLGRIRALAPARVELSHDDEVVHLTGSD